MPSNSATPFRISLFVSFRLHSPVPISLRVERCALRGALWGGTGSQQGIFSQLTVSVRKRVFPPWRTPTFGYPWISRVRRPLSYYEAHPSGRMI